MKIKLFYALSLLFISLGTYAQNISIPDANFKAKLLSSSPNNTIAKDLNGNYFKIDANGDGEIQQSEANEVGDLAIIDPDTNIYIQNYQGILSFVNVKSIKIDYSNAPSSGITVSNLNLLENLDISFSSFYNENASINNCPNLKDFSIKGIALQNFTNTPLLKNVSINLSLNTSYIQNILASIQNLDYIENLTLNGGMGFNDPTFGNETLNLSNHQSLKQVTINHFDLLKLDVSHCNLLNTVNIDTGNNLPSQPLFYFGTLDMSYCPLFINLTIDANITGLVTNGCQNLQSIKSYSRYLNQLSTNNCPALTGIDLVMVANQPQMVNCPSLKTISISQYEPNSFDASTAVNLENLDLAYYGYGYSYSSGNLQNLNVSNNLKLKTLSIYNHTLTQFNCNGLPNLESLSITAPDYYPINSNLPDFSTQFLQSATIQNCPLLTSISFDQQQGLKTVNIKNCPSLTQFNHSSTISNVYNSIPPIWNLQSLDIEDCNTLNSIDVSYNKLNHLKVKNASNLEDVNTARNQLASYEFTNTNNLKKLQIQANKFTSFNTSAIPSLVTLNIEYNQLNSLTGTSDILKNLNVVSNNLTDLNINNYPNLDSLVMGRNRIVDVDFSGHSKIRAVSESSADMSFGLAGLTPTNNGTFTKTFNVNNCTNLEMVYFESSSIEKIFMKNGKNELSYFPDNSSLQYICCDPSQIADIEYQLVLQGITANVNDYCNFIPGGNHNTIKGTVRFDENNNGCDSNDEVFEYMKLKINDGISTGETFVTANGTYNFFTKEGDFTLTAEPENPSLYAITPSTFTVNFADSNNNISTQNICVTKNGNVKDLEVIFAPVTDARPGFDTVYKAIWRNKGNTTLSGNVVVTFDNLRMNFLSSSLPSTVAGNKVTFNVNDLKPYANNSSELIFKINTPTNSTNPVNNGDILNFNANIPVSGDSNPDDNNFNFQQTVVGSFDPNDITCLEGNTIPSSMVGKYLHYIINFENTGTAPATNIVVEMEINPDDLDISSLQLQNTSHSSYTKITGNKVEFMMKDINLAALAHGNIALKIKSKNTLVSGDSISNKANIYFDYNYPVETNEAVTTISNATLQTTDLVKNSTINIFPNPTKGDVNIEANSKIKSVEIYDAQGRIVQKQIGINAEKTKLSIHNANSGMYIFKIITEKETVTKKVIKN